MSSTKKLTKEEFIERAKKVHGDKYDYSKVEYKNGRSCITIICPIHGEFTQKASSHLEGHGCKKCGIAETVKKGSVTKTKSKEWFLEQAIKKHGTKYDYSKVEYKNLDTKICIICPEHGEFWQTPVKHLSGGCKKCGYNILSEKKRGTKKQFIEAAKSVWGDKYDYSDVEYVNQHVLVKIRCKEHDFVFYQSPCNHLSHLEGCELCRNWVKWTTDKFIAKAKEIHGDVYDYSETKFETSSKPVKIICKEHGPFYQNPLQHLKGSGCSKCKSISVLEKQTEKILKDNGIKYEREKRFKDILGKMSLDFFLPDYNIAIECQGRQHFIEGPRFENLEKIVDRDRRKNKICNENGIKIIYLTARIYKNTYEFYNEANLFKINDFRKDINKIIKKEDEK